MPENTDLPEAIERVDFASSLCYCRFSHDVTKIQTTKLLILLIFYFNEV